MLIIDMLSTVTVMLMSPFREKTVLVPPVMTSTPLADVLRTSSRQEAERDRAPLQMSERSVGTLVYFADCC